MKFRWIILSLGCLFFLSPLQAQRFRGEILGGISATQVEGDEVFGFHKFGVNAGAGVMYPFNFQSKTEEKHWALSMEMLLSQKGSFQRNRKGVHLRDSCPDGVFCDSMVKYRLRTDYVSIPLMLHYIDTHTGWVFGAGVAYNRMFRISEVENGMETNTSLSSGTYQLTDWTLLLDVRFRIYQQLKFNFRYEYSVLPIRTRTFYQREGVRVDPYERKQYNNVLTLRLIYMFNEPKDPVQRKSQKKF